MPAIEETAANTAGERKKKRIFLFSDGTGNSSAKLFKTNVWQLYQAIDLGPAECPEDGRPEEILQIAYYNNGVGTSTFRPLAVLGGIFGFGLKQNVLNLYRFLCRNYRPGDEILAFGFSRGAFTIRMLIALITSQGIVKYNDDSRVLQTEEELGRQSAEAFRRMRQDWRLNAAPANAVLQWLRELSEHTRDFTKLDIWPRETTNVTFVGLWDTVAAYGGPVAEITRAIDDWIWPLTMPDYKLSKSVQQARHALALDDARDSFHPLLWDETDELVPAPGEERRLKQIWFSGMHADVGGGYPDDSLSYVSLTWMIEELGDRARFIDTAVKRAYDLSNDFGPMHDSRHGAAGYYRYQPRRIAALLHPVIKTTLSMRDPNIRRKRKSGRKVPQGLIHKVYIHESVLRRMLSGTDGYSPLALPRRFTIVRRKEKSPHAERLPRLPSELQDDLDALAGEAKRLEKGNIGAEPDAQKVDPLNLLWDRVWRRRIVYFVTVILSLLLATAPLWPKDCSGRPCADSAPFSLLKAVLPDFADWWINGWRAHPFIAVALVLGIWISMKIGVGIEGRIRDEVRKIWTSAIRPIAEATDEGRIELTHEARSHLEPLAGIDAVKPTRLFRIRNSSAYQRGVQLLKWRVLPTILGPVMIGSLLWLLWTLLDALVQIMAA